MEKNCLICKCKFFDNTKNKNKLVCNDLCSKIKRSLDQKIYRLNNLDKHRKHNYLWVSKNKHKKKCQDMFYRDLKKNPHLYPKECCICGVTENIEFHHPNYDFAYSVYPLCKIHHIEIHKNINKEVLNI